MRNTTTKKTFVAATAMDPFARAARGARAHPRRDEGGHPAGTGTPPAKKAEPKGTEDAVEDKPKGKSDAEKVAEKSAKDEKARADALQAKIEELTAKHSTEDEKKTAETVKTKVTEAVAAREAELTSKFEEQIGTLRGEIIDGLIATELASSGRTLEDFKTVIASLDKSSFVDDNGAVKKADVSKWASELAGSSSRKPPRTGGSRAASENRGMGQYLPE